MSSKQNDNSHHSNPEAITWDPGNHNHRVRRNEPNQYSSLYANISHGIETVAKDFLLEANSYISQQRMLNSSSLSSNSSSTINLQNDNDNNNNFYNYTNHDLNSNSNETQSYINFTDPETGQQLSASFSAQKVNGLQNSDIISSLGYQTRNYPLKIDIVVRLHDLIPLALISALVLIFFCSIPLSLYYLRRRL